MAEAEGLRDIYGLLVNKDCAELLQTYAPIWLQSNRAAEKKACSLLNTAAEQLGLRQAGQGTVVLHDARHADIINAVLEELVASGGRHAPELYAQLVDLVHEGLPNSLRPHAWPQFLQAHKRAPAQHYSRLVALQQLLCRHSISTSSSTPVATNGNSSNSGTGSQDSSSTAESVVAGIDANGMSQSTADAEAAGAAAQAAAAELGITAEQLLLWRTHWRVWEAQIDKDCRRTFPGHDWFSDPSAGGAAALKRVLSAFCLAAPQLGYCQGMNFLTGGLLLLLLLPIEQQQQQGLAVQQTSSSGGDIGQGATTAAAEAAVCGCLLCIAEEVLPGYYSPAMVAPQVDVRVLSHLIAEHLPALSSHLSQLTVDPALPLPGWLLSGFVASGMPFETVARLWDVAFFERSAAAFIRACLAMLHLFSAAFMSTQDLLDAAMLLQSLPGLVFDADRLLLLSEEAFKEVNATTLQALQHCFRAEIEAETDRAAIAPNCRQQQQQQCSGSTGALPAAAAANDIQEQQQQRQGSGSIGSLASAASATDTVNQQQQQGTGPTGLVMLAAVGSECTLLQPITSGTHTDAQIVEEAAHTAAVGTGAAAKTPAATISTVIVQSTQVTPPEGICSNSCTTSNRHDMVQQPSNASMAEEAPVTASCAQHLNGVFSAIAANEQPPIADTSTGQQQQQQLWHGQERQQQHQLVNDVDHYDGIHADSNSAADMELAAPAAVSAAPALQPLTADTATESAATDALGQPALAQMPQHQQALYQAGDTPQEDAAWSEGIVVNENWVPDFDTAAAVQAATGVQANTATDAGPSNGTSTSSRLQLMRHHTSSHNTRSKQQLLQQELLRVRSDGIMHEQHVHQQCNDIGSDDSDEESENETEGGRLLLLLPVPQRRQQQRKQQSHPATVLSTGLHTNVEGKNGSGVISSSSGSFVAGQRYRILAPSSSRSSPAVTQALAIAASPGLLPAAPPPRLPKQQPRRQQQQHHQHQQHNVHKRSQSFSSNSSSSQGGLHHTSTSTRSSMSLHVHQLCPTHSATQLQTPTAHQQCHNSASGYSVPGHQQQDLCLHPQPVSCNGISNGGSGGSSSVVANSGNGISSSGNSSNGGNCSKQWGRQLSLRAAEDDDDSEGGWMLLGSTPPKSSSGHISHMGKAAAAAATAAAAAQGSAGNVPSAPTEAHGPAGADIMPASGHAVDGRSDSHAQQHPLHPSHSQQQQQQRPQQYHLTYAQRVAHGLLAVEDAWRQAAAAAVHSAASQSGSAAAGDILQHQQGGFAHANSSGGGSRTGNSSSDGCSVALYERAMQLAIHAAESLAVHAEGLAVQLVERDSELAALREQLTRSIKRLEQQDAEAASKDVMIEQLQQQFAHLSNSGVTAAYTTPAAATAAALSSRGSESPLHGPSGAKAGRGGFVSAAIARFGSPTKAAKQVGSSNTGSSSSSSAGALTHGTSEAGRDCGGTTVLPVGTGREQHQQQHHQQQQVQVPRVGPVEHLSATAATTAGHLEQQGPSSVNINHAGSGGEQPNIAAAGVAGWKQRLMAVKALKHKEQQQQQGVAAAAIDGSQPTGHASGGASQFSSGSSGSSSKTSNSSGGSIMQQQQHRPSDILYPPQTHARSSEDQIAQLLLCSEVGGGSDTVVAGQVGGGGAAAAAAAAAASYSHYVALGTGDPAGSDSDSEL